MKKTIIIGSRGSDLALWQAKYLQTEIARLNLKSELSIIKTQGDKIQHLSLEKLEGKGFFTKEIEDALLNKAIDLAVHSHKDLPTEITPGLVIGGVSYREDPSELILIRKECVDELKEFHLKQNALVGTSASRRNVQVKFFRPDIICEDIRGNVPTRIEKLRKGEFDAIILAFAGVNRLELNIDDLHVVKVPVQKLIPAPSQGVLAFQCRKDDIEMIKILEKINNAEVAEIISVERKVMNLFQGGCHMPLGVFCKKENGKFEVWAAQADEKNGKLRRLYKKESSTDKLSEKIFNSLISTKHKKIFISTPLSENNGYISILENAGYEVENVSFVNIKPLDLTELPDCDWLFFTSKNGVKYFFDQLDNLSENIKLAAIGNETANQIRLAGYKVDFVGDGNNSALTDEFVSLAEGQKIIFPGASNRQSEIPLRIDASCDVEYLSVYHNSAFNAKLIEADILVFTSSLNVKGYLLGNSIKNNQIVIAMGTATASYLRKAGIVNVLIPPQRSFLSIAEFICGLE